MKGGRRARRANNHHQLISPAGSPPSATDQFPASMSSTTSSSSKELQDQLLPIANVSRIMKRSLPANAKVSKEAKETVQECVSEFISFITGEASDKCQREKRKTVNGDDLLWAMTTLGFDNYVAPLKVYLGRYRETEGEKNSMARQGEHEHEQYDNQQFDQLSHDPNPNPNPNPNFNSGSNQLGTGSSPTGFYPRMLGYGINGGGGVHGVQW